MDYTKIVWANLTPPAINEINLNSHENAIFSLFRLTSQTTHNITTDADYTLTADQNSYGRIIITDTSVFLTTARNIVLSTEQRQVMVYNGTAQTLTFKTSAGTGIAVSASSSAILYVDGTNVVNADATGASTSTANTWTAPQTFDSAVYGKSAAMAANDMDLSTANYFSKTISGATTVTFSNFKASPNLNAWIFEVTNASTNITWPASVNWPNGTQPTWSTTGTDLIGFMSRDGGTTVHGFDISIGSA